MNASIDIHIDFNNIPEHIRERAATFARVLQDTLAGQEGVNNFYGLYSALLLAGANIAILCPTDDDPQLPSILGWSCSVLQNYSDEVRSRMFHKQGRGMH